MYGSLRQGQSAHHLLQGCRREADGAFPHSEVIEYAGYPMLQPGACEVHGEVYVVPAETWDCLDAWEEAPEVYERVQRHLVDGRLVWAYQRSSV